MSTFLERLKSAREAATPIPWRWELCPCGFDDENCTDKQHAREWGHHGPDLEPNVISSIGYDADSVSIKRPDAELIALLCNNAEKLERLIEVARNHPHATGTSNARQFDATVNCATCEIFAALDGEADK